MDYLRAGRCRCYFSSTINLFTSSLFVVLLLLQRTSASGTFELKLVSFHTEHDGRQLAGLADQQTIFRVCLKQYQNAIDPNPPCTFGSRSLSIDGHQQSVNFGDRKDLDGPIQLPFSFTWPKTFSLIVEAWSNSSSGDKKLLLRLAEQKTLPAGSDWSVETHSNNGSKLELRYRVVCDEHYFGDQCKDYCRPRDDEVVGHFGCSPTGQKQCIEGWQGENCNKPVCKEGCLHGICKQPGECLCKLGYIGELCDKCQRYPGCKHGTCEEPFQCTCNEGWGGLFCNQDLNYCTHHKPCMNGATCTNTGDGHYTCACQVGFSGTNCEIPIQNCTQLPCQNGGTCQDTGSNYTCTCPEGISGRHCQITATSCADHPCQNGGTCVNEEHGGYSCLCPSQWIGVNCDTERNKCQPNPCQNGGRCVEKFDQDSFTCVCPVGFEGPTCATNIDDCMNDACKNGGVCVDEVNSFKCRCPPGYSGSLCQDNVDECAARPCANGGTCFDMNNDYKCMCRPGFKGKSCTIDINECDSSPCRNGGSCEDQIDSFICHCPPCFTGDQCNVRNDDCHWEPTFRPGNYSIATTPAYSDQLQASSSTDAIILAVGIPIVILFLIIVLMLLAGIFFLHRRSKGQTNIPNDMEAQNAYNARQLYNNIQCGPSTPRNQYDQQHHPDGSFLKPTYKVDNTERYATIKAKHVDNSSLDSGSRPTTPAIVKVTTSGLNAKTPVHVAKGVNDVNSTMNRKAISVDKLNLRRAPHSLERGCVSPDSGCSTSLEPPPLHGMKSEISKDSGLGSPVDDAVDDFADRRQRERTLADLNSCPAVDLPGRGPSDLPRRSRSRTPSHRHQRPSVSSSRDSSLGTATTRVCTDLATQV